MKISEVQKFIRGRIEPLAEEAFAECACADDGDCVAAVERALAEIGLAVIVLAPRWKPTSTSAKMAVGELSVIVRVAETPDVNRARAGHVTGCDLSERLAVALNLERPFPNADILALDPSGISATSNDGVTVIWDVPFRMVHQLDALD